MILSLLMYVIFKLRCVLCSVAIDFVFHLTLRRFSQNLRLFIINRLLLFIMFITTRNGVNATSIIDDRYYFC